MKSKKRLIIAIIIIVIISVLGYFIYNKMLFKNYNSNYMILHDINKRIKEGATEENFQNREYITLGNVEYIVFEEHEDKGTVELISKNALGSLILGNEDEKAIGNTDLEKAIWSYNNAVESIVSYCKEVTGLEVDGTKIKSIRSVGNRDVRYTKNGIEGKDTTKIFNNLKYTKSKMWFPEKYKIKNEDTKLEKDLNRIIDLKIDNARNILGGFKKYL